MDTLTKVIIAAIVIPIILGIVIVAVGAKVALDANANA